MLSTGPYCCCTMPFLHPFLFYSSLFSALFANCAMFAAPPPPCKHSIGVLSTHSWSCAALVV